MTDTYLKFRTPHYSFNMTLTKSMSKIYDTYYFLVGEKDNPCLDGHVTLENKTTNTRYNLHENEAILHKIDALEDCCLEDITTEYQNRYSFGKELLSTILFFINSQFERISTLKLSDMSYIPCNRETNDTLDLLTYSIALYKETWYEKEQGAYILPKEKHNLYRAQVEMYASKNRKNEIDFDLFYNKYILRYQFPKTIFDTNIDLYRELYFSSDTFPEFFIKLNRTIEKKNKCRFFKSWLFDFISSQILIERTWYIDLFPKIELVTKSNYNRTRRSKTQRNTNHKF